MHSHKFGLVDESGYQYCTKCGRARFVPKEITSCEHTYTVIDRFRVTNTFTGNVFRTTYVSRCTKCGDIVKEDVN